MFFYTYEEPEVRYHSLDFDIYGLIKRIDKGDIIIPRYSVKNIEIEGFQREFIWKKNQMDKFIETIFLKYPTPGIFFIEQEDGKLLVLDGQQRLLTLYYFWKGFYPESTKDKRIPFIIDPVDISENYIDYSYRDSPRSSPHKFDNYHIPATIIITLGNIGNRFVIYDIFNRLNNSGTPLNSHEIRIATWTGRNTELIHHVNENDSNWRMLYGKKSRHMKDHEFISRVLSIYTIGNKYDGSYNKLMNLFYEEYFNNSAEIRSILTYFSEACEILVDLDKNLLKPLKKFNPTWGETLITMTMHCLRRGVHRSLIQKKIDEYIRINIDTYNNKFINRYYGKNPNTNKNFYSRMENAYQVFDI